MKMCDYKTDNYFIEYKSTSDFWNKRINRLLLYSYPFEAVFLIGKEVNRAIIYKIDKKNINKIHIKYRLPITTIEVWCLYCILNEKKILIESGFIK